MTSRDPKGQTHNPQYA